MRSFFQSLNKPAPLSSCALVRDEGRDGSGQFLGKARNVRRRNLFEAAEADVACDDRCEAPVIGAS